MSDEHGLEFKSKAVAASKGPVLVQHSQEEGGKEEELEKRLAALRG